MLVIADCTTIFYLLETKNRLIELERSTTLLSHFFKSDKEYVKLEKHTHRIEN